jgi:hypothetical protein
LLFFVVITTGLAAPELDALAGAVDDVLDDLEAALELGGALAALDLVVVLLPQAASEVATIRIGGKASSFRMCSSRSLGTGILLEDALAADFFPVAAGSLAFGYPN